MESSECLYSCSECFLLQARRNEEIEDLAGLESSVATLGDAPEAGVEAQSSRLGAGVGETAVAEASLRAADREV